MHILITGAGGFVGSHLVDRMLAAGHQVTGVDNFITGQKENLAHLKGHSRFKLIEHDVIHPLLIPEEIDWVMHFASPASPPRYLEHPIATLRVNAEGTRRMLELARKKKAGFFLASTSEVYGDPQVHPQPESYWGMVNSIGPRSVYDEGKRYAEAITMTYNRRYGVDTRIIRIFNTYGPRMALEDGRVVSNFICQALDNEGLTIYGDGSQTRSFQYVDDLVEGIVRLMRCPYHEPVNLGNPEEYSMSQLAEMIRELTNSQSTIEYLPLPTDDPKQRKPDISLAKEMLDWSPRVKVSDGLARTMEDFRYRLQQQKNQPAASSPAFDGPAIQYPGLSSSSPSPSVIQMAANNKPSGLRVPVSVVMPAYNAAEVIEQALTSITMQDRPVDQVVVVNDGSKDDTLGVLEMWADRLPLTIVNNEKNLGIKASLRRGVEATTGELILRLDADDRWTPSHVERMHALALENPDAVLFSSMAEFVEAQDSGQLKPIGRSSGAADTKARARLMWDNFLVHSATGFRKGSYEDVGGYIVGPPDESYPGEFYEDYDLWIRLLKVGGFAYSNEPTVEYVVSDDSLSRKPKASSLKARWACQRAAIAAFWRQHPIEAGRCMVVGGTRAMLGNMF